MANNQQQTVARAKSDLAKRLGITENEIAEGSVENADFPDMSLGAPVKDEMSGQMIVSGHRIQLSVEGKKYEYRADDAGESLRLLNFKGVNHIV
jgi:hypothetical protein